MDKFNPRDNEKLIKAYEKIIEQIPYDGIHINHQSKIDHIKNIYGGQYKVVQSPSSKSWYVLGKNGNEWIPVTSSFNDQAGATKFMQWLTRAGEMQKKMVGTIDGTDKRINETQVIGQDTESLPKCPKCGRNHMPDDECPLAENTVEYKPIKSPKKPFSYKNKWYTRDEMKRMGLDKEASQAIKKELNIKENVNESAGGRLHGVFSDLYDYLENNFFQGDPNAFQSLIPKLKKETDKLYDVWKRALKGKLIGW